jgi:hypothetical protein
MERINTTTAVPDLFGAGKKGFRDGDKSLGVQATNFSAAWANIIQEEIANVVEAAGITLSGADRTQLLQAIEALLPATTVITAASNTALDNNSEDAAATDWVRGLLAANIITSAENPALDNDSASAAATSWVQALLASIFTPAIPSDFNILGNTNIPSVATIIAGLLGAGGHAANDYMSIPYRNRSTNEIEYLIVQWGVTASVPTDSTLAFIFPVAFPNATLFIGGTPTLNSISVGSAGQTAAVFTGVTTSGATICNDTGAQPYRYFVIGY